MIEYRIVENGSKVLITSTTGTLEDKLTGRKYSRATEPVEGVHHVWIDSDGLEFKFVNDYELAF